MLITNKKIINAGKIYTTIFISTVVLFISYMLSSSSLFAGSLKNISSDVDGNFFYPQFSTDGRNLSYELHSIDKRSTKLYIYKIDQGKEIQADLSMNTQETSLKQLSSKKSSKITHEMAWSYIANGNNTAQLSSSQLKYVYSCMHSANNSDICMSGGAAIVTSNFMDAMPKFSPAGETLAFVSTRSGEGDIYSIDLGIGKTEKKLTQITRYNDSLEWFPSWSPDGKKLAFVRHLLKGGDNIWVIPDISNPQNNNIPLTNWKEMQIAPTWSPDSKQVAFYSNHQQKHRYDLYVVDAQINSQPILIANNVVPNYNNGPAWSQDSKYIFFVKNDFEKMNPIYLANTKDPSSIKIIPTNTVNNRDVQVFYQPDGHYSLVFSSQGRISDTDKRFFRIFLYTSDIIEFPTIRE